MTDSTDFFNYYSRNPVGVIDRNNWLDRDAEVNLAFNTMPVVYTPLVQWTNRSEVTGAQTSEFFDLLEGDVNNDEIAMNAQYIPEPFGVDGRSRRLTTARYGDKVQFVETSNIFQMWKLGKGGQRDWRPVLRGLLGQNVIKKMEILSRNAYLNGPSDWHTFAGDATSIGTIGDNDRFGIEAANQWNLRLGQTGTPVVPGDVAAAKLCIVAPGAVYDFQESLKTANSSDAAMWKTSIEYSGMHLRYEIGSYKNIRYVQAPSDRYGINPAVLYNCGAIVHQTKVTAPINMGAGSPNPDDEVVDGVWRVGQSNVTHYIQLDTGNDGATPPVANTDMSQFKKHDFVSIHVLRTNKWGVTGGVDVQSGRTIVRRIVKIDTVNKRLSFDRPIMQNFTENIGTIEDPSYSGPAFYAFVTKARHIGMNLVLGSIGGILGNVNRPLRFYEPKPIDDFDSVWRFSWDMIGGFNLWEQALFEVHFSAVSTPKPGGVNS